MGAVPGLAQRQSPAESAQPCDVSSAVAADNEKGWVRRVGICQRAGALAGMGDV